MSEEARPDILPSIYLTASRYNALGTMPVAAIQGRAGHAYL